ncbi:hypothetical protein [Flavobacterium sp.]|jgi:hypothetical protein|uniref:hypothetical protein n=1 Tax=Flavobacterium sp. TaxID=239 RepID=UPI0037C15FAA
MKNVLVLMTADVRICDCVEENIKSNKYEVVVLANSSFKYKSIKDRIVNFYKKIVKKDKSYKRQLIRAYEENQNLFFLEQQQTIFDYTLVIRPDKFSLKVLEAVKIKSKKMIAYQWDGMSRFPEVTETIDFFDEFYVFDKNDIESNSKKLTYTTNFYFDCYNNLFKNEIIYDVYFIGSYDSRTQDLLRICSELESMGLKINVLLATSPKKHLKKYKFITYLKKSLTYYENLEILSRSKIIIDLAHKDLHTGLSFRAFESVGYDKKMITTNKTIKSMDFYNPQNIFVFDDDRTDLIEFVKSDYISIPETIKNKYSFSNWFNYMFKIEPFENIKTY